LPGEDWVELLLGLESHDDPVDEILSAHEGEAEVGRILTPEFLGKACDQSHDGRRIDAGYLRPD
jgi:hypothetical protein